MITRLFFPRLKRRSNYKKNRNNNYYPYNKYRAEIQQDCLERCVYCDIHQFENGGEENMVIDHFRPHSNPSFKHLKNNPNNLHWSCSKCNQLKSDTWPAIDNHTIHKDQGFIDPFVEDRKEYFKITISGDIIPKKAPAKYKIGLLNLNRDTLKRKRKLRIQKYIELQNIEQIINQNKCLLKHDKSQNKLITENIQNLESYKELILEFWGIYF